MRKWPENEEMEREDMRSKDPWLATTKKLVREWVKENVARKGKDAVLWGKWDETDLEEEKLEDAYPRPTWTEKQMRRRGEPPRKKIRRDEDDKEVEGGTEETEDGVKEGGSKAGEAATEKDGKVTAAAPNKKELAKKKAERREKLKAKKDIRDKKKHERETRKRETEEKMIKIGEDKNRRQPKLRRWAIGEGGLERKGKGEGQTRRVQKTGGKKGVG